jgi:putative transposase
LGIKKRYSDEQIVGFLREAESGVSLKDLCWRHSFSHASFHPWRNKFAGLQIPNVKRLKILEAENARLMKLLAEAMLEQEATHEVLGKKVRARRLGGT